MPNDCLGYSFPFTIYDLHKEEKNIHNFVIQRYKSFSDKIEKKEIFTGKNENKSYRYYFSGNADYFEVEAYNKKDKSKNFNASYDGIYFKVEQLFYYASLHVENKEMTFHYKRKDYLEQNKELTDELKEKCFRIYHSLLHSKLIL